VAGKQTKIADMGHRVALCTAKDVVVDNGTMEIRREAVRWTWAAMEHQTHLPSFLSQAGYAIKELAERATHRIRVRTGIDVDFASTAWVYETRLKSPPRWYKVLGFVEEDCHIMLECHLQERNDDAQPTETVLSPAKQDVVL
jgi:hypothetical protein